MHLMITIQKVTSNVQSVPSQSPRHLVTRRAVFSKTVVQYSTVHIPNVFCDGHLRIISCVYCNRQVHRDFLITLYRTYRSFATRVSQLKIWHLRQECRNSKFGICDKSVATQNLAFVSYWYRKKRLQMQF